MSVPEVHKAEWDNEQGRKAEETPTTWRTRTR